MAKVKNKVRLNINGLRKVTQSEMASSIGTNKANISRWEKGEVEPDLETLIKLAKYFNVTTDYLLGIELPINSTMLADKVENSFGSRLKFLRTIKNLSQQKVASALEITQSQLNKIEHNYIETNFSLIRKIANYFNVTADYLLGIETSKEEVYLKSNPKKLQVLNVFEKLNDVELDRVYNYLLGLLDARE